MTSKVTSSTSVCSNDAPRIEISAWVPAAPIYPYGMRVAPLEARPDLPSLSPAERDAFGSVLTEALARLEAVFDPDDPAAILDADERSGPAVAIVGETFICTMPSALICAVIDSVSPPITARASGRCSSGVSPSPLTTWFAG